MGNSFGQVSLRSCYQMIVITDDLAAMEEILPERSMIIWTGSLETTKWSQLLFSVVFHGDDYDGGDSDMDDDDGNCDDGDNGDDDVDDGDGDDCDGDGLQRSAAALKRRLSVRSCELISIFSL